MKTRKENPVETPTNEGKHQVHNIIVLDESGSMASIEKFIIDGFNELVQTIKGIEKQHPEQEHFISLVSFNGLGIKTLHFVESAHKLEVIDSTRYKPDASTPLFDAIGFALTKLKAHLRDSKDCSVLVTIMTDGEENASKEYSVAMIKQMIDELKTRDWTFTYIGTDHDIDSLSVSISIENRMYFDKSQRGIAGMFEKERYSRMNFGKPSKMKVQHASLNYFSENESLYRFVKAQAKEYKIALSEIQSGRKQGHWMWYIFPQIAGLGYSDTAQYYAIQDMEEATDYLHDDKLSKRLIEISEALLKLPENNAEQIFGYVDTLKLRSSMTLFSQVPNANPVFQAVLDKFFDGKADEKTLEILEQQKV
jgi:uncharacterized protein (DUF1810 family)